MGIALVAAGCARGTLGEDPDGGRGHVADGGGEPADAKPPPPDAPPHVDAPPLPPDAPPPPDGCTVQQVQLLTNPAFDGGGGTWVQAPADPMYPIIGPPPDTAQTAPNIAWMGGLYDATDRLYQDVAIPANATALSLRAYRWIQTEEFLPFDFDVVTVDLRNTSDGLLANMATWSNQDADGGWTLVNGPAPSPFAGQTIRVDFRSSTDGSWHTNFLWDSLALRATVCN